MSRSGAFATNVLVAVASCHVVMPLARGPHREPIAIEPRELLRARPLLRARKSHVSATAGRVSEVRECATVG